MEALPRYQDHSCHSGCQAVILALATIQQQRILGLRARGATQASPQHGRVFRCRSTAIHAVARVISLPAQSDDVLDQEQRRASSADLEETFMDEAAVFDRLVACFTFRRQ